MGLEIDRTDFEERDYENFADSLGKGLKALGELLRRPGFGVGEPTIGAEVELCLIDRSGLPLLLNRAVLADALESRLQLELDRFNLEYNTSPVPLAGRPFTALSREIESALGKIQDAASKYGGRVVTIGILPTLRPNDLESRVLTDLKRYQALSAGMRRLRRAPFAVAIEGEDNLTVTCDDVTLEGANTSLQLHLRVSPAEFARVYNAAQIATAPALAASGNSPIFLGHRLWEETRVALFGQAIDERSEKLAWRPARVSFGHGWVREGAFELFAESIALHTPLLPVLGKEDSLDCVASGGVPRLDELRLHHGTVWRWNRAVYDPSAGGHLRAEMRGLPAGPSVPDMMANSAFLIGLTLGLAPTADWMVTALPFRHAHDNFYAAARYGLDAVLYWPREKPPSPRPVRAGDLIPELILVARQGLLDAGVNKEEIDRLLGLFGARAACRMTGARWQRRILVELEKRLSRTDALRAMLERYVACAGTGSPVHCWPIDA